MSVSLFGALRRSSSIRVRLYSGSDPSLRISASSSSSVRIRYASLSSRICMSVCSSSSAEYPRFGNAGMNLWIACCRIRKRPPLHWRQLTWMYFRFICLSRAFRVIFFPKCWVRAVFPVPILPVMTMRWVIFPGAVIVYWRYWFRRFSCSCLWGSLGGV